MENVNKRKIPKPIRKLNLAYQIIMAILFGVNIFFSTMEFIPETYYKVSVCVLSIFPIVWSKILDATKSYYEEATPNQSPKPST